MSKGLSTALAQLRTSALALGLAAAAAGWLASPALANDSDEHFRATYAVSNAVPNAIARDAIGSSTATDANVGTRAPSSAVAGSTPAVAPDGFGHLVNVASGTTVPGTPAGGD